MLMRTLRRRGDQQRAIRPFPSMSFAAWQNLFSFNGSQFLSGQFGSIGTRAALGECGPAFAALDRRASVLGEARPMFQAIEKGKPTRLFAQPELSILDRPWPGGTWRMLTAIMEADVAAAGNSYWIRMGDELTRLDPDWVTIVTESSVAVDVNERMGAVGDRLLGYAVQSPGSQPMFFEPEKVAHYRPGCPVNNPWQGESWLASVITDVGADVEMTRYKQSFLRNGAMPSVAVLYDPSVSGAQLEAFIPMFEERYAGQMNAGKTMHLLGGRDVKTIGATLDQLAFKAVQGAGETRIAMAAGVPAVVLGASEGLAGSSLNAGNYVATRRLFADAKMRPLLGAACEALARLVRWNGGVVGDANGVRLWYDDSGVSFFQEDVADEANIRQTHAMTIRTLIEAGYEPDAAVTAVTTGNFAALTGAHTGLTSVQLQPSAEPDGEGDSQDDDMTPGEEDDDDAES